MDVDRYLHELTDQLLSVFRRSAASSDDDLLRTAVLQEQVGRFAGAVDALVAAGVIPDSEAPFRLRRFREALAAEPGVSTRTVTMTASASATVEVGRVDGPGGPPTPRPPAEAASDLRAVVPVIARIVDTPELRLTVVSVELWSATCVLRWAADGPAVARPPDSPDSRTREQRREAVRERAARRGAFTTPSTWQLTDDLGTRYLTSGGGGSGSGSLVRGFVEVQPAVPTGARRLTATYTAPDGTEGSVEIDLPDS